MSQRAFFPATLGRVALPDSADRRSEADLIQAARTCPDAFALLYRRNYPAIEVYIRRRVGDEHIANDLVAETFMAALQSLPGYRDRGLPFRSWLYRLATSRVSRWARRLPKKPVSLGVLEPASVEPLARRHALQDVVREALLSLPLRYQNTLALHYLQGLTVDEVALALDARPGTVKARLSRGREQLRRKLAPYAEELNR